MWEAMNYSNEIEDINYQWGPDRGELIEHDVVEWPLYDYKIKDNGDTEMWEYYVVNSKKLSWEEYEVYKEEWMQWVLKQRMWEIREQADEEQQWAEDVLDKID